MQGLIVCGYGISEINVYLCRNKQNKGTFIMMEIGSKAPEVLGHDENGNEIRLSQFKGQKLVLYFYPKDLTSGCTTQACNLRDNYAELKKQGYAVVGVSVNDEKSHKKFIEKNDLPFPLIADTDKKVVEEFGARKACTGASISARSAPRSSSMKRAL